jgi:hypothetical protein
MHAAAYKPPLPLLTLSLPTPPNPATLCALLLTCCLSRFCRYPRRKPLRLSLPMPPNPAPSHACMLALTSCLSHLCRYRRRCRCRRHRILPPDACCCLQAASPASATPASAAIAAAAAVAADSTESCHPMHAAAHKPPLPRSPPLRLSLPTPQNPATRCMLLLTSRLCCFCRYRRRCRC